MSVPEEKRRSWEEHMPVSSYATDQTPGGFTCTYPQSHATRRTIREELDAIAANKEECTSFYLDTLKSQSDDILEDEGSNHHQGLARTHMLLDGSIYFFLSHSETGLGNKGKLMQFRYSGPTEGEHPIETSPKTVAPLAQLLRIEEQHPADIAFLGDVNNLDAGYLFVTELSVTRRLSVYRWAPFQDFVLQGSIFPGFPHSETGGGGGPKFVFVDRVDKLVETADLSPNTLYFLGIANGTGLLKLYSATPSAPFPVCAQSQMDVSSPAPQPFAESHHIS
jgi:hypothetical protein